MHEAASVLTAWANFYVIAGSSAAALTGLMFVVITLVAGKRTRVEDEGISTFSTPTVVHLCAALLVSAALSAPWRSVAHAGIIVRLVGLFGVVYVTRLTLRARRLTSYQADSEDWVWFMVLPLLAYVTLVASAVMLGRAPVETLFALAGGVMLLIFIAIHNAWDIVTYLAVDLADDAPGSGSADEGAPKA